MKIQKIWILFLLLGCVRDVKTTKPISPGSIFIWNTLHLGWSAKDYHEMSIIIKNHDLIGLVEVMNEKGVRMLIQSLKSNSHPHWKYHISPYPTGSQSYSEYYAFIWNTNRVKLLGTPLFYTNNSYKRYPYGAYFKAESFDFYLILTHIVFGKKRQERMNEVKLLSNVYHYFQNLDPTENDIIIAGDFNLPSDNEAFSVLKEPPIAYKPLISPKTKTTISEKGLASSYDNILINHFVTEFANHAEVINATRERYTWYKKNISDHLPIIARFDFALDND